MSERWEQVKSILEVVLEHPEDGRAELLETLCPSDEDLRAEVERLLAHAPEADAFFEDLGRSVNQVQLIGDSEIRLPDHLGRWRILREVGQGGMGQVLEGVRDDGMYEQRVAIKLVRHGLAPDLVHRFHGEVRILASLEHPSIARLIDGGQAADGRPFLVMEFVDGEPITEYCSRRGLFVADRLSLFGAVCEAAGHAHRHLVVHRDLKPSNILVTEDERGTPRVKLLDFGLAKLVDPVEENAATRTAHRAFTPAYAAPEQIRGEAVTTATDVYALGVLLFELLTGVRPFQLDSATSFEEERSRLTREPDAPSVAIRKMARSDRTSKDVAAASGVPGRALLRQVRGDLDRITEKALRREPDDRYASAEALGHEIDRHLRGLPIEARAESMRYALGRLIRRHRYAVAAVVLVFVSITGGLAISLWQMNVARAERDRAERINRVIMDLFGPTAPAISGTSGAPREHADDESPPLSRNYFRIMANAYESNAMWNELRNMAEVYQSLSEAYFAANSPQAIHALCTLGRAEHRVGNVEAARRNLRECVRNATAVFDPSSEELSSARASLAAVESPTAFADRVVSYDPGPTRPITGSPSANPEHALGAPDYGGASAPYFVSLGGGGSLTLAFDDNVLVDGIGADLVVYEIGPAMEPIRVFISEDGIDFVYVGLVTGGEGFVDIGPSARPGAQYRFVKLVDAAAVGTPGEYASPGADVDAVLALPPLDAGHLTDRSPSRELSSRR